MKQILFYCLIFLCYRTNGQQIRFRNYSVAEGLPSSTVRTIAQDDQGYLWFGTKNGISRFDGYQFRNFQYKKNDSTSLGNNFLHCITRIDSTHLWIGTESGIYILDLEKEQFSHFGPPEEKTVFDIMRDKDGMIWFTSRLNGLYRYDPVKKALHNFKAGNSRLSSDQVTRVAQDDDGNIWIGTYGNGIDIYNPSTGSFTNMRAGSNGLSNDFINTLYKGRDGIMWVGTMNGGLCKWQPAQRSFYVYRNNDSPYSINDDIIRAICQVSPDKIYVGTEKGLNVLDVATDRFTAYMNKGNDPFSISDNAIYSLFPDRAGTMWIGTFFGGASYFNEKGPVFELYYPTGEQQSLSGRAVSSFLEDGPGKLWIGTEDGGLQYFNTSTRTFQQYPFLPNQQKLSYHNIHTLLRDKAGNIWIGLFAGGLNVLDPGTGKIVYYRHRTSDIHSLNSDNIFCIYQDKDGGMWIGTDKGLDLYDSTRRNFTRVLQDGVDNTIVYDIYEDDNKTVWFATYNNGLIFYNKKTEQWGKVPADGMSKLTCLYDDHQGNLWIGSDGGGLHQYNFRTKQVASYNDKAGINANVVYGIRQDDAGLIWITTNNGIYSIDPAKQKARHFTPQDNLQSRQFNYKAFYKMSDGKLFAGGIKGFNAFYPEKVSTATDKIRVSFTNFQLFNRNVPVQEDGPLSKQINYTDKLILQHNQSVISFEFAALNFSAPEKLSYAYKMEGFDADWNYVGDQRKATYTNLSSGTYTFRVKATEEKSNWDVTESRMQVIIKPPFYRTTVAYIIFVLLALALAYGIYRYSSAYIRRKNQIRLERLKNKEEQEFYARKIEFFTVMAHEIRTPLSLIIAPLEKLLSMDKWQQEEKQQLVVMDENAERLMDLVNQLLDFRRIESDAYEIRKEEVEVVSLVQSIYSRFSSLPYQKELEFTLSLRVSSLLLRADPEVLNKILSNLLINAFRYAKKKVSITVYEAVAAEDGASILCISVEDDGIGIPAADLKNIFKQFFTTVRKSQEDRNPGGTGIGLALASSLAHKHGGKLLVESREGEKAIFTLELPVTGQHSPKQEFKQEDDTIGDERPVILVVEDDVAIQTFLAGSFRSAGYNVLRAANGKAAMQLIEEHSIDLVISDIMMPEVDGLELCLQVKTNIEYSHIPFMLLSARGNSESELKGIEAGADAYIMKPFKWKHIVAVAKNLIASRENLRKKFSEQPNSDVSVLTTNSRDKVFMETVVRIIEERIIDPQLSVEELSRNMSMSRSNLHKKLKSLSGYVPNELIKLVRLKHAAKLLVDGEHTVAEVAYMTGFSSPSYFSKCFLQQFKVSPKEYADSKAKSGTQHLDDLMKGD
ncbi:hybrid sensor histidine kinase/response regulator transcription factor [Chitinophaga sp. S165]|uniref:hybrid sensor histidine kinase/response regulator transcription factor n=1 Tax=Chitinophaga sp. S165 TaxID=2135462 RepID=UPI000D719FDF|nr:hybrid sensor histidine kinase/response regulator transcription factor [Chitinophaga sp. S165]PWV45389.1 signal transduction histidine kinase [Chitinophaga sp. S165]